MIAGTEDRLTPPVHARAVAAALPDCLGLVELAGMGHMTPVEAPEAVTAKIRELVTTYLPDLPEFPERGTAGVEGKEEEIA